MAKEQDITVVKGDTARWSSFIYDETTGSTFNFTDCIIYMQVRNGYNSSSLVANYSKEITQNSVLSLPNGLTGGISAATGGTLYLCIGSSYSSNLSYSRVCKYDVKVHNQSLDDFTTVLKGNIQVLPEITDT
jgi:hypothetical protein